MEKKYKGPIYLLINGVLLTDPVLIAEDIAKYFESVSADDNFSPEFRAQKAEKETPLDFTTEEVHEYNKTFYHG